MRWVWPVPDYLPSHPEAFHALVVTQSDTVRVERSSESYDFVERALEVAQSWAGPFVCVVVAGEPVLAAMEQTGAPPDSPTRYQIMRNLATVVLFDEPGGPAAFAFRWALKPALLIRDRDDRPLLRLTGRRELGEYIGVWVSRRRRWPRSGRRVAVGRRWRWRRRSRQGR